MSGALSRRMTILTVSMPTTFGSPASPRSTTRVESGLTYRAHAVSTMNQRVVPGIVLTSPHRQKRGRRGCGAVLPYAYTLNVPATAARIHAALGGVLDCGAGSDAQLTVAADLLQSAARGDHPPSSPRRSERWLRPCPDLVRTAAQVSRPASAHSSWSRYSLWNRRCHRAPAS